MTKIRFRPPLRSKIRILARANPAIFKDSYYLNYLLRQLTLDTMSTEPMPLPRLNEEENKRPKRLDNCGTTARRAVNVIGC